MDQQGIDPTILEAWQSFRAEQGGTHSASQDSEKKKKLERFLKLLLVQAEKQELCFLNDQEQSWDSGTVCNVLAQEFLSDVHECCSAEDGEKTLVSYLLSGNGCLLVQALKILPLQGLSCGSDLCSLLVSLLPLLVRVPLPTSQSESDILLEDIDFCLHPLKVHFRRKNRSKKNFSWKDYFESNLADVKNEPRMRKGLSSRRLRHLKQWSKDEDPSADQENSSVESDTEGSEMYSRNKSSVVEHENMWMHSDDTFGFDGINPLTTPRLIAGKISPDMGVGDMYEERDFVYKPKTIKPAYHLSRRGANNGPVEQWTFMDMSAFELCQVLLSLLEKLSHSELAHGTYGSNPASTVLHQLTHMMASLSQSLCKETGNSAGMVEEDETDFVDGWSDVATASLQRMILRNVLTLCSLSCTKPSGISELAGSGIIATLLDAAKEAHSKISRRGEDRKAESTNPADTKNSNSVHNDANDNNNDEGSGPTSSYSSHQNGTGSEHDTNILLTSAFALPSGTILLVHEILRGVLMLINSIVQTLPINLSFLSQALNLLNEFYASNGYQLVLQTISQMEELLTHLGDPAEAGRVRDCITSLITAMFKVVISMKKAKVDYVHIMTCLRRKHKRCEYGRYIHHHHDICGLSSSSYEQLAHTLNDSQFSPDSQYMSGSQMNFSPRGRGSATRCCIAVASETLLQLLSSTSSRFIHMRVLAGIDNVGVCCCMLPFQVLRPVLGSLPTYQPNMRGYALSVLSRILLEQLGGMELNSLRYESCTVCGSTTVPSTPVYDLTVSSTESTASTTATTESAFYSITDTGRTFCIMSKWEALGQYQELLRLEDSGVSVQVARHLLHLVAHANEGVRKEFFIQVYLPLLQEAPAVFRTSERSMKADSPSRAVMECCLLAFPVLLTSPSSQHLFLTCGGVHHLAQLLHVASVRPAVLQVFEVLLQPDDHCHQSRQASPAPGSRRSSLEVSTSSVSSVHSVGLTFPHRRPSTVPRKRSVHSEGHKMSGNVVTVLVKLALNMVSESQASQSLVDSSLNQNPWDREASYGANLAAALQMNLLLSSTPLNVDAVRLPSDENLGMVAEVWRTCGQLFCTVPTFRDCFLQQGGYTCASHLLTLTVNSFCNSDLHEGSTLTASTATADVMSSDDLREETAGSPELDSISVQSNLTDRTLKDGSLSGEKGDFYYILSLFESTLAICLKAALSVAVTGITVDAQNAVKPNMTVDQVIQCIRTPLLQSGLASSPYGHALCDALLNTATLTLATPDGSPAIPALPDMSLDGNDELLDEDLFLEELQAISDTGSEQSDRWSVEEGYEADSERDMDDSKFCSRQQRALSSVSMEMFSDHAHPTIIVFPQLCSLTLDLLVSSDCGCNANVVCRVLDRLCSLVKGSEANSTALYKQDVVEKLLKGFKSVLTSKDESSSCERTLLLELFMALSQHTISAQELTRFFALFHGRELPLDCLLKTLLKLTPSMTAQPSHILSFPTIIPTPKPDVPVAARPQGSPKRPDTLNIPDRTTEGKTGTSSSAWQRAPVQIPIKNNVTWPPRGRGLSLSMWLRLESMCRTPVLNGSNCRRGKKNKSVMFRDSSSDSMDTDKSDPSSPRHSTDKLHSSGYLHLVSCGSKALMMQTWVDTSTGTLTFRICVDPDDGKQPGTLTETTCPGMLASGQWQHLCLSYCETMDAKNVFGTISLVVDGHLEREVLLEYTPPPSKKQKLASQAPKMHCLLGHCTQSDHAHTGTWSTGNVMVFNDILQRDQAFQLFSLGPDAGCLSQCRCAWEPQSVPSLITKEALRAGIREDLLTGQRSLNINQIKENLVAVYSPKTPATFNYYSSSAPPTRSLTTLLTKDHPARKISVDPFLETPAALPVTAVTELQTQVHRGLQNAVHEVGGVGVFLFLYAKVVELSEDEETQAQALHLLFLVQQHNQRLAKEFSDMDGCHLLGRVLLKDRCKVGFHTLKVLLDACCDSSVMEVSTNATYSINPESDAIIQDTTVVSELLLAWQIWQRADVTVWQALLTVLETLIRDNHPHQMFNIRQLLSINIVYKLLQTCQEHQSEDLPSLPPAVCQSFVSIVQCTLGCPPDLNLLTAVCDFLLAVHPAINTFVCHAPSSFYFTLHSGTHQQYMQKLFRSQSSGMVTGQEQPSPNPLSSSTPLRALDKMKRNSLHQGIIPEEQTATSDSDSGRKVHSAQPGMLKTTGIVRSRSMPNSPAVVRRRIRKKLSFEDGGPNMAARSDSDSSDSSGRGTQELANGIMFTLSSEIADGHLRVGNLHDDRSRHTYVSFPLGSYDKEEKISTEGSNNLESGVDVDTGNEPAHLSRQSTPSDQDSNPEADQAMQDALNELPSGQIISDEEDQRSRSNSESSLDEWENLPHPNSPLSLALNAALKDKGQESRQVQQEDGVAMVCTGLLNLMCGVFVTLPDAMLDQVMGNILKPETLVVLAHHHSSSIRTAIIKLLGIYFQRAKEEQFNAFMKVRGFFLLANQLHQHCATRELVEACLSVIVGKPVGLDEDIDVGCVQHMTGLQQHTVVPLLALLENCIHDTAVCHNTLCVLIQLFESSEVMAAIMMENGLVWALCNVISAINSPQISLAPEDQLLLVGDVQHFLACVVVRACSMTGVQNFQVLEDMVTLLGRVEDMQRDRHQEGSQSVAVERVRNIQYHLLQAVLSYIEGAFNDTLDEPLVTISLPQVTTAEPNSRDQLGRRQSYPPGLGDIQSPPLSPTASLSPPLAFPPLYSLENNNDSLNLSESGSLPSGLRQGEGKCLGLDSKRRYSAQSETMVLSLKRRSSAVEMPVVPGREGSTVTEGEIVQRIQRVCVLAVNLLSFSDPGRKGKDSLHRVDFLEPMSSEPSTMLTSEREFTRSLFQLMLRGVASTLESSRGASRRRWHRIMWSSRDCMRVQLGRLMVHMMGPRQPLEQRVYTLKVVHEPNSKQILNTVLHTNLSHGQKVVVYLYYLLFYHKDRLNEKERTAGKTLMRLLDQISFQPIPLGELSPETLQSIDEDQKSWDKDEKNAKTSWRKRRITIQNKLIKSTGELAKQISWFAMEVTQAVVLSQNMERKKLLEHMKESMTQDLSVRRAWHALIQQLTHERAVWFNPESQPSSWQLDPTEGPCRVRQRLQRCHLNLSNKYFLPEAQRTEGDKEPCQQLSYLFEDSSQPDDSTTLRHRLHTNEAIRYTHRCTNVTPSNEATGEILIGENSVYFVGDEPILDLNSTQFLQGDREVLSMSWLYEDIKEVHKRWYQLRDNALEIFITTGRTLLLAFETQKDRDMVCRQVLAMDLPNLVAYDNLQAITQMWKIGQMTNFEYLTHLNKHSGRSFNDLMQYPVFPFVLGDYTSDTIDLTNPKVYRELAKPIAVQDKSREQRYIENFEWLRIEHEKGGDVDDPMPPVEPYHYGSHYSNSGTVLHFLVRLPPFTTMFLNYQDRNFDIPDRTFHSLLTTWRLSSFESTTDVKELIPEFFFLPEFLLNSEGFNFGHRQSGHLVNDVALPPWAQSDSRLFVLIHRQALESDLVSMAIHTWIDLVFGWKQKGKAAVEAINVFHPSTYFGIDTSAIEDKVQRRATETMIKTYGQTPRQLFKSPHPPRQQVSSSSEADVAGMVGAAGFLFNFKDSKDTVVDIKSVRSPLPQVEGLKWGNYVGSPTCPAPAVHWSQDHGAVVSSLVGLPTGEVCGLAPNFCLLVMYSKEKGVSAMNHTDILWSAILSWGHPDGIMRLKSRQSEPATNFFLCPPNDQVTCCASVTDCRLLFTGGTSGVVTAYPTRFTGNKPSEFEVVDSRVCLYGHTGPVSCLQVCRPYSIVVSGSQDGTAIIWDINRLSYVQCLNGHEGGVTAVAVSETSGDIATVCHPSATTSELSLWTINARPVGSVRCLSTIHCVAFSNAPEGISVNVVAAGLQDGSVRLWSTWDLSLVRDIKLEQFNKPIISLTFTHDAQHLYVSTIDGTVFALCKKDQTKNKRPLFIPFLS
ncbi:lysosomal-trafficking regulator-like isoform X1 [Branchiostoma floridae x Branchiostoma japonicum]